MANKVVAHSLAWKFFERGGVQGTKFLVSIVIARLILPSAYGAVALLVIFTSLATIFVQSGLNTAIIQKKDADDADCSAVLLYTLGLAILLYAVLFVASPYIAVFFHLPELKSLLRVLAIILFPGAITSLQLAILSKRMEFKTQFYVSLISAVISGIIGIVMAYMNFEAWALVGQQLSYQCVACLLFSFSARWHMTFKTSFSRTKPLLKFGSKLLGANLINTLYHNLESLIIGKEFSPATLAFCDKGKMFPLTLIDNIDGSVQTVMLPAFAAKQNEPLVLKSMLRRTISISTYMSFAAMSLLAAAASPTIRLVLGEKWMDAVPYMQIFCIIAMLFPLQTANLEAFNAVGKSGIYLKLMMWKRAVGTIILFSSVIVWHSPFAVVLAALIIEIASVMINAPYSRRILGYSLGEMISDILPNLGIAVFLGLSCWSIQFLITNPWILLGTQIIAGLAIFIGCSALFKNSNFEYIVSSFSLDTKIRKWL